MFKPLNTHDIVSEEIVLLLSLNLAVGSGVGDACEDKAVFNLIIVEEGAVALVDRTGYDLTRTGGAGAGPARVRHVNASLLSNIENVCIICALNRFLAGGSDERDRIAHLGDAGSRGVIVLPKLRVHEASLDGVGGGVADREGCRSASKHLKVAAAGGSSRHDVSELGSSAGGEAAAHGAIVRGEGSGRHRHSHGGSSRLLARNHAELVGLARGSALVDTMVDDSHRADKKGCLRFHIKKF